MARLWRRISRTGDKRKMTKEEFEQLKSTVKQWLFHTGSLDPTDYVNELKLKFIEPKEKRIAELEAQIEKMKNWCNCKNYQQCLIELAEQGKGMKPSECCVNCKKWEVKEK